MTGTVSRTVPAFWKVRTSVTLEPPISWRVRCSSSTVGCGLVSSTARWRGSLISPPGSWTDVAVPGAVMLSKRSGAPMLTSPR